VLCKVDNIQFYRPHKFTLVLHPEHEPLQIIRPVGIVSDEKVILAFSFLPHLIKIGAFEIRIERHRFQCKLFLFRISRYCN
jgi:hypothetical protein